MGLVVVLGSRGDRHWGGGTYSNKKESGYLVLYEKLESRASTGNKRKGVTDKGEARKTPKDLK